MVDLPERLGSSSLSDGRRSFPPPPSKIDELLMPGQEVTARRCIRRANNTATPLENLCDRVRGRKTRRRRRRHHHLLSFRRYFRAHPC